MEGATVFGEGLPTQRMSREAYGSANRKWDR